MAEAPHDRVFWIRSLIEPLYRAEVDDAIRTNLRMGIEALSRAAIQMEQKQSRLRRKEVQS